MKYFIATKPITREALNQMSANKEITPMPKGEVFEAKNESHAFGSAKTFVNYCECIWKTHCKEITEKQFTTAIDKKYLKEAE